ncbi:MAG TPA: glycosyltransferase family 4 protein [Chloroflexota bacterium]|jgi:glycosyltransferase involved in cell wall biosynthesis
MARERLKIAFVVPRYGEEIGGGAEGLCRRVVERLVDEAEVTVLTTCARDYERWANHYPAGRAEVCGVPVERFPVTVERDPELFAAFSDRTIARRFGHGVLDELQWLLLQGPCAPGLVDAIRDRREHFDLFVFWIYLYFPTYFGLPAVGDRALFVPLAHDEPPFHLDLFRPLFRLPRRIAYMTGAEKALVEWKFGPGIAPGDVVGAGAEPPGRGEPARFRRRYGIADPFVLYVGRVNPSKGCRDLVERFATYKALRPSRLKLVLAGNVEMALPRRPDVVALGYVDDQTRADALAACELTVTASAYESFSLSLLESWLADRTALVNAAAEPMRQHVETSGGGLWFEDEATFCAALDRLLGDAGLRRRLAAAGRRYAEERYAWDAVYAAWKRAIEASLD